WTGGATRREPPETDGGGRWGRIGERAERVPRPLPPRAWGPPPGGSRGHRARGVDPARPCHPRTAHASARGGASPRAGALPYSRLAEPPDDGARPRGSDARVDLATDVRRWGRPEESRPRRLGVEVRHDRIVVEEPVSAADREGCKLTVQPEASRRRPI